MNIRRFYTRLRTDHMLLYIALAAIGVLLFAVGGIIAVTLQAPEPAQIPIQTPAPSQTQTTAEEQQLLMQIETLKLKVYMAQEFYNYAASELRSAQGAYSLNRSAANYAVCYNSYNAMVEAQRKLIVAQQELYDAQRRLAIVRQR